VAQFAVETAPEQSLISVICDIHICSKIH